MDVYAFDDACGSGSDERGETKGAGRERPAPFGDY